MLGSVQANIIDVGVRKIVPGGREADVDLAWQIDQLWVALAVVSNHVVNSCRHQQAGFSLGNSFASKGQSVSCGS